MFCSDVESAVHDRLRVGLAFLGLSKHLKAIVFLFWRAENGQTRDGLAWRQFLKRIFDAQIGCGLAQCIADLRLATRVPSQLNQTRYEFSGRSLFRNVRAQPLRTARETKHDSDPMPSAQT